MTSHSIVRPPAWRAAVYVLIFAALISAAYFGMPATAHADGDVNIYTYREPGLIRPLIEAFEAKTGIKAHTVFDKDGLIERATAEAENSPADVILTNEFGLLIQAKDAGITGKLDTPELAKEVPAAYRDPDGEWVGLTRRARIVYASKERVAENAISYEDLADPKWKGRICTRSGQHTYTIGLLSSMIAHHGLEFAETWAKALRDNLARKPSGGDREQVQAVYAGECDLAIGNTYYMKQMLTDDKQPEQKAWANSVKLLFPNAGDRGTHVNISGAVILKNAPNRANGLALIAFLASPEGQAIYASANGEYPIDDRQPASDLVRSWGELKADPLPLAEMAKHRKEASEMMDRIGFDQGPAS